MDQALASGAVSVAQVIATAIGKLSDRLTPDLVDTAESAATVTAALDPLCRPSEDDRTPTQRRADALVDVCKLALGCGDLPDSGGERPQVVVTVPFDVVRGELAAGQLDSGDRLSPEQVRKLACDARIIPMVLGGDGQVLDVGQARRLFTGPLRRALVARDGGCAFPGCDRPPRWCHGHHIKGWKAGGHTAPAYLDPSRRPRRNTFKLRR